MKTKYDTKILVLANCLDHGRPWSFDRKKDHGRSRGQKKTMVKDHLVIDHLINDQMVIYQKRPVRPVFLKKKMGDVYL